MLDYTFFTEVGEIILNLHGSSEVLNQYIARLGDNYIVGNYKSTEYYIDSDKQPILLPSKPNDFSKFNYNTKQWEFEGNYLTRAKTLAYRNVNQTASDSILEKYPYYRQLNAIGTSEYSAMRAWIDEVRAESNVATSSIDLATDLATIEGIVEGFIAYLANL